MPRYMEYVDIVPGCDYSQMTIPAELDAVKDWLSQQPYAALGDTIRTGIALDAVSSFHPDVYYRISEDYLEAFRSSNIDTVPCDSFRVPFPCFDVLLPVTDDYFAGREESEYALPCAIRVVHSDAFEKVPYGSPFGAGSRDRFFRAAKKAYSDRDDVVVDKFLAVVAQAIPSSPIKWPVSAVNPKFQPTWHAVIPLVGGLKFGDAKEINTANLPPEVGDYIKVVVILSLLAIGHDRIVEPDVLSKDLVQYREARQADNPTAIATLHDRATRRRGNKRGYVVGRQTEQTLRPTKRGDGAGRSSETGELQYQHLRSGHLHGFHTKDGYVLKWINPLTVRADLPPNPNKRRGYKV